MKGFVPVVVPGVDEQTIIDVLTKRTYGQRRDIAFAYERKTKKVTQWDQSRINPGSIRVPRSPDQSLSFQDMISALKGALSGSLEAVILGLMKSTTQYDASEIKRSVKVNEVK